MIKNMGLLTVLSWVMTLTLLTSYASAMYNPTLGRFLQRDPIGYIDGLSQYQYIRSNPTNYQDAMGMKVEDCCPCEKNPADCYLEYSSLAGADIMMNLLDAQGITKVGYEQEFHKRYYVTVKSKSGTKTAGCHIQQSALVKYKYIDKTDVVPFKPEDFNKDKNSDTFSSQVDGLTVTVKDSLDYDGTETKVDKDGNAVMSDRPGLFHKIPIGFKQIVQAYSFSATNWVKEAPGVKGTIEMSADYEVVAQTATWKAKSSDNKIDEKSKFQKK